MHLCERWLPQGQQILNISNSFGIENKSESKNDNFMHLIMINIETNVNRHICIREEWDVKKTMKYWERSLAFETHRNVGLIGSEVCLGIDSLCSSALTRLNFLSLCFGLTFQLITLAYDLIWQQNKSLFWLKSATEIWTLKPQKSNFHDVTIKHLPNQNQ